MYDKNNYSSCWWININRVGILWILHAKKSYFGNWQQIFLLKAGHECTHLQLSSLSSIMQNTKKRPASCLLSEISFLFLFLPKFHFPLVEVNVWRHYSLLISSLKYRKRGKDKGKPSHGKDSCSPFHFSALWTNFISFSLSWDDSTTESNT